MIYEVYVDGNLLYYPNDETYSIIDAVVETSLNEAGSFECDVPISNPRYEEFALRKSMLQVTKDGIEIFNGEIREVTQKFNFTKHIYAVGELAMMFDSIQPQAKYQGTVTDMVNALVANHNSQVEDRKKFTVGNVLVSDPNNYILRFTNREDTLTALRDKICAPLDGYLRIRKSNGVRYLDVVPLESYGNYCTQEISFGENLLDYSANYTAQDIATCVIPLGVRLNEDQRTADAVEGLDEYLTIKGTSTDDYHADEDDDFIYSQSAVNQFGWVRVVKNWDDVTIAENLKEKAEDWLSSAQYSKMELELNAVDLNLLDHNIESFEVGDTIHAWAEPYNMDTTFPVRKKTTYINDLSKNYIVLSNNEISKSYTKQASNAVNEIREEIPETFPLLEEARMRALAMLLDESMGGHVVFEYVYDENGHAQYIDAISLCDQATIDASLKRWRWSQGAFGFMERASVNVPWNYSQVKTAMTATGEINASMITTGTLNGNNVNCINIKASSVAAENITGSTISGKNLNGCSLLSSNSDDYVSISNGDIFGGSSSGQHGYLTFSALNGGQRGVALTGGFVNINGNTTINGNLSVNGQFKPSNASGTITWIDSTQGKVFQLSVSNGIVTGITEQRP